MGRVFVHRAPIAFGDVDYARILYYPRLFHYCHVAFEAFTAEAFGMPYAEFLSARSLGFPTVHVEADYHRPLAYGAELELLVSVVRIGTKSMTLRYRGRVGREEAPRVEARGTNVLVDMERFEPLRIPEWIREALGPWVEASASR